jgi:hypothetical protein
MAWAAVTGPIPGRWVRPGARSSTNGLQLGSVVFECLAGVVDGQYADCLTIYMACLADQIGGRHD